MKGRPLPRCNPDGSYAQKQCHKTYCFCVNKDGVELYGTRKNISDGDVMCGPDPGKSQKHANSASSIARICCNSYNPFH